MRRAYSPEGLTLGVALRQPATRPSFDCVSGRARRTGLGCLFLAIGIPVAFVAYLYVGLAETYGTDYWWEKLILWAILLVAVAAAVWGVVLLVRRPDK